MKKEIRVRVPATVANLVSGFDVLGMAVNTPFDEIKIKRSAIPGIRISHADHFGLPNQPEKNVAGVALMSMMQKIKDISVGWDVEVHKNIKPGSGLGSSAASATGVVFAANVLLNNRFDISELVSFAMEGEKLASGAAHADNVVPCLYGGITLVRPVQPFEVIPLPAPDLHVVILHPQIEMKTSDARKILPKELSIKDASRQWGNVGTLVAGICTNNPQLMSMGMEDLVAEPYRKKFIPFFDEVKEAALISGALGGGISGSGPSIFMICNNKQTALQTETAMRNTFGASGIDFNTYVTGINCKGIEIIG